MKETREWGHTLTQGCVIEEKTQTSVTELRRVSTGVRSGGVHSASPRTIGLLGDKTGELF